MADIEAAAKEPTTTEEKQRATTEETRHARTLLAMVSECDAMVKWATNRGRTPTQETMIALERATRQRLPSGRQSVPDVVFLSRAHRELSELVHPARPETVLRLDEEATSRGGISQLLGPLPIVRRLVVLSVIFLVSFVLFASSGSVRASISDGSSAPADTSPRLAASDGNS
jgi:hypothetical protein